MATFFEIVRQTLDRGYADIKGERDEKIKARLVELANGFSGVLTRGGPLRTHGPRATSAAWH
jgi:hypothetical protein